MIAQIECCRRADNVEAIAGARGYRYNSPAPPDLAGSSMDDWQLEDDRVMRADHGLEWRITASGIGHHHSAPDASPLP
ncbi:hypothetical protein DSL92_07970 [Billgrantia gudaonensis]|uniref:Uncharacterized protein n=1 Tax=Billgrantia gudaonensis TaxID=376427 RepID=A0A3S0R4L5_9GAMM|nr:hypothetical protein DSL92_07970 [Halomonas gudaonensis]